VEAYERKMYRVGYGQSCCTSTPTPWQCFCGSKSVLKLEQVAMKYEVAMKYGQMAMKYEFKKC
jgi:hypothetical protein